MSYQVLARKWRPRSFATMVGQEHVLRALINALDEQRLHHAYLFTGTRGVGKTTVARIFAKSLNCEQGVSSTPCGACSACLEIDEGRFIDLIEVDAASRTKVEDTRELLENVQYAPTRGRFKVYLIDEVHMLSTHSFNALLKTLEEPPPHVKFLLATTDPQKLPVTILSRCLQFNLKRMSPEMIAGHLTFVLKEEGIEADEGAILQISEAADGSMRDALSLLDQAIAYGGGKVVAEEVRAMLGTIDRTHVFRLLDALSKEQAGEILAISEQLAMQGIDFGSVLGELISALHRIALAQVAPGAVAGADREEIERLAAALDPEQVQLLYQIALTGRRDLQLAPEQRAGFEMVLLRMLAFLPLDLSAAAEEAAARAPASSVARPSSPQPEPPAPPAAGPGGPGGLASLKAALKGGAPGKGEGAAAAPKPKPAPAPQRSSVPAEPEFSPPPAAEGPPLEAYADMAPAPEATASNGPELRDSADWRRLVERLGLQGMAYQLAINAVLERREGDTLHLTLAAQHASLRIPTMEARLQERLGEVLGRPVQLRFEVAAEVGQETPAQMQAREARDRRLAALETMLSDPTVRRICERFDGRVLEDSVQPID